MPNKISAVLLTFLASLSLGVSSPKAQAREATNEQSPNTSINQLDPAIQKKWLSQSISSVSLTGNTLTTAEVVKVANGAQVTFNDAALDRVRRSHEILLLAATSGHKIYGLTAGVGLNKDQAFVNASGGLTEEVIEVSRVFNRNLIYAHSAGVGPEMELELVRAIMVTRLNAMLFGATGVQPKVVELYRDFLNNNITPVVPSRGSVGEADITLITHIGLAMMGEGDVYFQGQKMPASQALIQVGIEPLVPFGKDALSILSSNAYSAALGAIAIEELKHLLALNKLLFSLSLEALNGNIEPFLQDAHIIRPFPHVNAAAKDIRTILDGSYLWLPSEERALQDPLSYRTGAYTLGAVENTLAELESQLKIQLNSSDDNPAIVLDVVPPSDQLEEATLYVNEGDLQGALIPTANFSPLPWAITFQEAAIALSHLSNASAQRTIKLADPHFTHLSRFLGTENTFHAYGAIQKVFASLAAENQELAQPVSIDLISIAGNIEDLSTNAPRVVRRVRESIDNLYYILSIEMMHTAQAINLRREKNPNLVLSDTTQQFFDEYRQVVSFLEHDRFLSPDIEASYLFLKDYPTGQF
ncbi:Histidine ammonia-lyase [[Leptolyngbya] sp. PCC 7376]|uniref:HAL/PAL/TAL family ammonia-lyase n=1 Tax=[Leptolyngbya] sp. PCC 7376 TaxID=111781 RepID=UPI00029F17B4|nr:aromatic amino acid ammonia-lyase [[Leptolyngbya] sp. PCC 7376]AFY38974.1 Histidine ammonia-lyase [[Leptolyngbya] sp. PCC 7376]